MRFITYLMVLAFAMCFASCTGVNKHKSKSTYIVNDGTNTEEINTIYAQVPINEIEEVLVPNDGKIPENKKYFVIIGSFRNPDNANKYQNQILLDGFNSEVLKNGTGLFRVTVMATDDIKAAREHIMQIRKEYSKYFDTWLLIQKDY